MIFHMISSNSNNYDNNDIVIHDKNNNGYDNNSSC